MSPPATDLILLKSMKIEILPGTSTLLEIPILRRLDYFKENIFLHSDESLALDLLTIKSYDSGFIDIKNNSDTYIYAVISLCLEVRVKLLKQLSFKRQLHRSRFAMNGVCDMRMLFPFGERRQDANKTRNL